MAGGLALRRPFFARHDLDAGRSHKFPAMHAFWPMPPLPSSGKSGSEARAVEANCHSIPATAPMLPQLAGERHLSQLINY